jgi:integrase
MRAPFSVFKRVKSGKIIYCARFFADDGSVVKTVSLHTAKNRTAAARMAQELLLKDGIPISRQENPPALDYLKAFWSIDSDYYLSRSLRGVKISARYVAESWRVIHNHGESFLKGKRFHEISPILLEKMVRDLSRAGKGPRVINRLLQAIKVPYADYCRMHRLSNPLTAVLKLRENTLERGSLTRDEVAGLIALVDINPRVYAAFLCGTLLGMRMGEVRGLEWGDIDENRNLVHIRHNWVESKEGSKAPKWGSTRDVPLPAVVLGALRRLGEICPEKHAGKFVFFNQISREHPISAHFIQTGFRDMLHDLGIDEETRSSRNISFHSLRHTFISLSRAAGVSDYTIQQLAGHSTIQMTDRYSHANVVDFADACLRLEASLRSKPASIPEDPSDRRLAELEAELAILRNKKALRAVSG